MPFSDSSPKVQFKTLSLIVTENCNLNCVYCYQVSRRKRDKNLMPFKIATEAISDHLSRCDEFSTVVIELIGGEVLLYFDFVRNLIQWTLDRADHWKKSFVFFLDTNGTILTEEMKQWLLEHKTSVIAGLSIDGTPEAHNLNRSGSYSRVARNIPFFAKTWPHQTVKMTISPKTIPLIADGIIHVSNLGFNVAANVPMEDIWGTPGEKAQSLLEFRCEMEKLVDYYNAHQDILPPNLVNLPITILISEERNRPWCGSGRSMIAVEASGKILPCNRYSQMSFDQSLFNLPLIEGSSKCDDCFLRGVCQTCEALNWEVNGNPNLRTSYHCKFTKMQVWATAQIQASRAISRLEELRSLIKERSDDVLQELVILREQLQAISKIMTLFPTLESCEYDA